MCWAFGAPKVLRCLHNGQCPNRVLAYCSTKGVVWCCTKGVHLVCSHLRLTRALRLGVAHASRADANPSDRGARTAAGSRRGRHRTRRCRQNAGTWQGPQH